MRKLIIVLIVCIIVWILSAVGAYWKLGVKISDILFISTTFFTGFAALGAWRSASETRNTSLAQIVLQIVDAYGSDEMRRSMAGLKLYKNNCDRDGKDYAKEFGEKHEHEYHQVETIDGDRRRFSHHFHKTRILLETKVVEESFIKKIIKYEQVKFLLDVVEPLEREIKGTYDPQTFDKFRALYHIS